MHLRSYFRNFGCEFRAGNFRVYRLQLSDVMPSSLILFLTYTFPFIQSSIYLFIYLFNSGFFFSGRDVLVKRQQPHCLVYAVCECMCVSVCALYKYIKLYLNVSKQTAISSICLTESSHGKLERKKNASIIFNFIPFDAANAMHVCTV